MLMFGLWVSAVAMEPIEKTNVADSRLADIEFRVMKVMDMEVSSFRKCGFSCWFDRVIGCSDFACEDCSKAKSDDPSPDGRAR
jgi:hypothetical protein